MLKHPDPMSFTADHVEPVATAAHTTFQSYTALTDGETRTITEQSTKA